MKTENLIKNLVKIKVGGVFGLVDKKSKRAYIGYSGNILGSVSRVVAEVLGGVFKYRNIDLNRFDLDVLESGVNIETAKLHHQYWVDGFKARGYEIINAGGKKPSRVRARLFYSPGIVEARLVNTRGDSCLVGVFLTKAEATEFIETYYGEHNTYQYPVIATNSLTKERVGSNPGIDGWRYR